MERIEENAKIVVLLLEQLINKEINIEINRSLNDLKNLSCCNIKPNNL